MLFDVPRNVLKIGPLDVWLSLVVGQNISLIIIIIIILHLGELQTTYECLKPKIHPPYCTLYARYKYSTRCVVDLVNMRFALSVVLPKRLPRKKRSFCQMVL